MYSLRTDSSNPSTKRTILCGGYINDLTIPTQSSFNVAPVHNRSSSQHSQMHCTCYLPSASEIMRLLSLPQQRLTLECRPPAHV